MLLGDYGLSAFDHPSIQMSPGKSHTIYQVRQPSFVTYKQNAKFNHLVLGELAVQLLNIQRLAYLSQGHAINFFRDSDRACTKARQVAATCSKIMVTLTSSRLSMGNTREPLGMVIAGEQFYIITSPQDVTTVYNNKKGLTFDEYIRDMLRSLGSSADGVEKMWTVQDHLHKNLAHAGEDFYRTQLLPGPRFEDFWPQTLTHLEQALNSPVLLGQRGAQEQSLTDLCRKVLLGPVATAFFGSALLKHDPSIIEKFLAFDDTAWKINYKIPLPFSRDAHTTKDNLIASFHSYLKLPKEQRSDASWLVQKLESEMRQAGIMERDMATFAISVMWTYV